MSNSVERLKKVIEDIVDTVRRDVLTEMDETKKLAKKEIQNKIGNILLEHATKG